MKYNNNNIFLICGNSRSGKTSFSNFIKKKVNNRIINTGMESLISTYSSRIIFNKNIIYKELINYFYSKRFEGKNRNNNLSLCDYFNQNELNEYIKNFDFKYNNLSFNIVDFLINFSDNYKKDIFFLDLNFEFNIEKYFKNFQNINILYFTRDLNEILVEVSLFRDLEKSNSVEKNILEKIYLNYFFSKKIINDLSKKYNTYLLNYNEIILKKNKDIQRLSNDHFHKINFDYLFQDFSSKEININKDLKTYINSISEFNEKKFTVKIFNLRIIFVVKFYLIYLIYFIKKNKIGFFISILTDKKNFISRVYSFSKKIIIDNF